MVQTGGGSIYYSPYMLALALPGKLIGLSAYSLYKLAAVVNIGLLLTGLYRFTRTVSRSRWAPPLALVGVLFWWGTTAFVWSGFLSLISFGDSEAYPSTIATALTLHLWAWLNDGGRTLTSPRRSLGAGALLALVLLIHQFTGLSAVIGCAAILLAQYRIVFSRAALKPLALGLLGCAAVILAWPYYHLWNVGQGDLEMLDPVHKALYSNADALVRDGARRRLRGALAFRWWHKRTDVLVLMFLGLGAVVGYGWASHHWSYGRSWPMLMLVAQVATAVAVVESRPGWMRRAWTVPVALCTAIGVWTQCGVVLFLVPNSVEHTVSSALGRYGWVESIPHIDELDRYFAPGDVVAASGQSGQFEVAGHGSYNVTSPWYLPEIPRPEQAARDTAENEIFAPSTSPAERLRRCLGARCRSGADRPWPAVAERLPRPRSRRSSSATGSTGLHHDRYPVVDCGLRLRLADAATDLDDVRRGPGQTSAIGRLPRPALGIRFRKPVHRLVPLTQATWRGLFRRRAGRRSRCSGNWACGAAWTSARRWYCHRHHLRWCRWTGRSRPSSSAVSSAWSAATSDPRWSAAGWSGWTARRRHCRRRSPARSGRWYPPGRRRAA